MKRGLLAVPAMLLVLACGGGGGGGGGGVPPPPPAPTITYAPATGSESANLALVEAAGSTPTRLRLDLVARNVTGLYGVAFDLVYPGAALEFVQVTNGGFLGGAGSTSLQVNSDTTGRLIVGLSRLGAVGGVSGSGTLLTLEFDSGAAGVGTLAFENNSAFDSAARRISGVTWAGGSVTVAP
jgi:hypothetical protein